MFSEECAPRTIFHIGPLAGLAALACAALLLLASFAILQSSNGQVTDEWKPWEPTVWLAIFTAVSNKLIAFAAVQGAVVSWWRKASVGTTLSRLHTAWSFGTHTLRALLAGRRFNALALACLCATFVAIDGPLLQRASTVELVVPNTPYQLAVHVSPELPSYWSGGVIFAQGDSNLTYEKISSGFQDVLDEFIASKTITAVVAGCPGTCTATILAPALATLDCSSTFRYANISAPLPSDKAKAYVTAEQQGFTVYAPDERTVFGITPSIVNDLPTNREQIVLQTELSDEAVGMTCAGQINTTNCGLVSAIAEYPVVVNADGSVEVVDAQVLSFPKIVQLANNTALTNKTISEQNLDKQAFLHTTLSGIEDAIGQKWYSAVGVLPSDVSSGGEPVGLYIQFQSIWFTKQHVARNEHCVPTWKDPRDEIMAWANGLMFHTGISIAQRYSDAELRPMLDKTASVHYNVTGYLQTQTTVFQSNIGYFAGAAVLQIFSILMILYTFYGWWSLGWRSVSLSFSPLEIAKAFDAPLLRDNPSIRAGGKIAKYNGDRGVQYTETNRSELSPNEEAGRKGTPRKMVFVEHDGFGASQAGNWSVEAFRKKLRITPRLH